MTQRDEARSNESPDQMKERVLLVGLPFLFVIASLSLSPWKS